MVCCGVEHNIWMLCSCKISRLHTGITVGVVWAAFKVFSLCAAEVMWLLLVRIFPFLR